jgi:hypothetical protein
MRILHLLIWQPPCRSRPQAWRKYAEVIEEFRAAKRAGLKIVFILRLYLSHDDERNKFLWHGAGAWG